MSSRRRFILESTLLAVAAVIAPDLVAEAAAHAPQIEPSDLGFEDFAGLMNQNFRTGQPGDRTVTLELIAADRVPVAHGEQFVLVFRGPENFLLGQDTYLFEQRQIGKFSMFIVPATSGGSAAARYVAVFNRLQKPPQTQAGQMLHAV